MNTCNSIDAYNTSMPYLTPVINSKHFACVNSGTTGNFLTTNAPCVNKQIYAVPLLIQIPDGEIITSFHTELFPENSLPLQAQKSHIFTHLQKLLLSIRTFCDHGCIAIFDNKHVSVMNKLMQQTIMTRSRDPIPSLYMIDISPSKATDIMMYLHPDAQFPGSAYECTSKYDLVRFIHFSTFYPKKRT